jgi:solute carrier family 25 phosphate transporter 3
MRGLVRGWSTTLIGYSIQGFGKFGFYEFFKNFYNQMFEPVSLLLIYLQVFDKFV